MPCSEFRLPVAIDRDKTLQAAQKYIERKRYDRAIVEYQRIVQEDPNDARTLLKIGDLQARLQAFPEAIATYDRVGQHYAAQQLHLKAIAVYKQIREIIRKHAPDLADRYAYIGPRLAEIYTELGLTSDALAAWDEVATRLLRAGRDREGIEVFAKMVELDAKNPLPHLRLAEACCRVHALDEAVQSFSHAAELLLGLNRSEDALKVYDRILHFRADPKVARAAAEIYLARGSRDDGLLALAKLQICFQADPRDLDTLGLLARAFTGIGQGEKAVEVYKEMARIARDQGRADLMPSLIAKLRAASPDDEHVRGLESLLPPLSPPESLMPASIVPEPEVVDVELSDEPVPQSRAAKSRRSGAGELPPHSTRHVSDDVEIETSFQPESPSTVLQAFDARAHARKAAADAESFRRLRLFSKAVGTLNVALEVDPLSIEIRTKLREILNEAGDREGAIGESVNIAALHIDLGENDRAEALLREVLRQDPGHEGALALLEQMSPSRAPASKTSNSRIPTAASLSSEQPRELFGADRPLPSYDLEEVSADQALSVSKQPSRVPDSVRAGPLPSFPLGEMSEPEPLAPFAMEGGDEIEEISEVEELAAAEQQARPLGALDEILEEAEFYVARGLLGDAHAILSEQLSRTPGHRLILERLREIEIQRAETGSSPRIDRLELAVSAPGNFDGSMPLGTLHSMDPGPEHPRKSPLPPSVDVEQLFAKVKAGIRADVSESDAATHYDLALAYKEMGLFSDALKEAELAARDPQRECMCYATIGVIHFDQGHLDEAIAAYQRALEAEHKTPEQEIGLEYDLAKAYERQAKPREALLHYQKVAARDANYRDVHDRAQALLHGAERPVREASGTRVVSDDDDFERVFDDLFESK
jgi:tetratricopeptide (TPR) repeat protein